MNAQPESRLESAIPDELVSERTHHPIHPLGTYTPPYPSYVGRNAPSVTNVVMAYFGVQSLDPASAAAAAALDEISRDFQGDNGPLSDERARYVDEAGYTTTIAIAYWNDVAAFDSWYATRGAAWVSPERDTEGVGYFAEILRPSVDRYETLFSAADRVEGVTAVAEQLSGQIEEHGYWGGMRDRFPLAQTDRMVHDGYPEVVTAGKLRTVIPQNNLCLIRSGQDITDTQPPEREFYAANVEPDLKAGMEFIRDEGLSIGCFANRYMTVLNEEGEPIEKTFGMSWWNDLASLETWAQSHPTHLQIFGSALRHLSTFGPDTQLRLYHEVTVAERSEQSFQYLNCHDRTGLLRSMGAVAS